MDSILDCLREESLRIVAEHFDEDRAVAIVRPMFSVASLTVQSHASEALGSLHIASFRDAVAHLLVTHIVLAGSASDASPVTGRSFVALADHSTSPADHRLPLANHVAQVTTDVT